MQYIFDVDIKNKKKTQQISYVRPVKSKSDWQTVVIVDQVIIDRPT